MGHMKSGFDSSVETFVVHVLGTCNVDVPLGVGR